LKTSTLWVILSMTIMIGGCGLLTGCRAGERLAPLDSHDHAEETEEAAQPAERPLHEHEREHAQHMLPWEERELPDFQQAISEAKSDDPKTAENGISGLAQYMTRGTAAQKATAEKEMLTATRHKDTEIVQGACNVLGSYATTPAAVRRLRQLHTHSNPQIRGTATAALAKIYGRTNNLSGLINMLGVYNGDASGKAVIQLTVMGRKTVPDLINTVRTSTKPTQRHGAALALAMTCAGTSSPQQKFAELASATRHGWAAEQEQLPADLRALPVFADAVINDDSPRVRAICAQGLGYLGDARAAVALAQALNDPVEEVRRRAAAALVIVPAKTAQAALEKTVRTDTSAAVRRYAAEALGWIGDSSVVPALIDAAGDRDVDVRRYAATQLGRMGEVSALQALVKLFDDPDEDVRWAAVVAVGKLRDRKAREALAQALDDSSPMVSHAAERGLQKLGIAKRKGEEFEQ